MSPPLVLTFAASDPTGGAGLQADVLSIAAMACHPLSVVTAITVQDTSGVKRLEAIDCASVLEQARALLDEMPVAAFKLGVLGSAENAQAIAGVLGRHPDIPVVLDPVLASGRGDSLAGEDLIAALLAHVVPCATVVTPNTIEAARLGGVDALLARGAAYVLLTGTHAQGDEVRNVLHDRHGTVREDRWPRLPGSYHGSGCTLASSLAAALARGAAVGDAAREAQAFTWRALQSGFRPGHGQSIPDRMFQCRAE